MRRLVLLALGLMGNAPVPLCEGETGACHDVHRRHAGGLVEAHVCDSPTHGLTYSLVALGTASGAQRIEFGNGVSCDI